MNEHHHDTNLLNLNGNLLCAAEIITTGSRPGFHDIIQICLLPINASWEIHKAILPFFMDVAPKRPDNVNFDDLPKKVNRQRVFDSVTNGIEAYRAADLLQSWFDKIQFKFGKRISILAYDWNHKKQFLIDWLTPTKFEEYFDYRYRDPLPVSLYCNDVYDRRVSMLPFPKVHFAYLCSQTKTEHDGTVDCLSRCKYLIELYQRMLKVP